MDKFMVKFKNIAYSLYPYLMKGTGPVVPFLAFHKYVYMSSILKVIQLFVKIIQNHFVSIHLYTA